MGTVVMVISRSSTNTQRRRKVIYSRWRKRRKLMRVGARVKEEEAHEGMDRRGGRGRYAVRVGWRRVLFYYEEE